MEELNGVSNVFELSAVMDIAATGGGAPDARTCWFDLPPREIPPEDWLRYRAAMA